jgi:hypothetical protein
VAGATQAFTITPAPSYIITDVTVDGSSVGAVPTYSFTNVSASHTISASFATGSYTITASAGTGGTITPNGTISVPYGGSQTFVIIPNTGYRIDYVVVNGSSQGPISSYQFPNVTTSHTISAAFAVNTTTVTATAGTGGSISPSGPVTINYGASQIFSITPNTNYAILNIIVDGVPRGPNTTYTFTNSDPVTLTHTIQATFTATSYDMILTAPKQGYLAFNTDVRFTVVGTGSSIRLGNNNTNLNNGDTVQLILRGTNTTNYGSIWIYGGTINRFNYANVAFYRNGVYQRKNTVTAIFIGGFTNYISSLMLEVPAASAGTSLTANGQTIISGTNSSRIRIYNLKPDSTGLFDLGNSATDVDYTGGANSYTVG